VFQCRALIRRSQHTCSFCKHPLMLETRLKQEAELCWVSPNGVQDLKVIKPGGEHAYADALQTAKLSKPVYQVCTIMVRPPPPPPRPSPALHGV
jgi:hypothetical protein